MLILEKALWPGLLVLGLLQCNRLNPWALWICYHKNLKGPCRCDLDLESRLWRWGEYPGLFWWAQYSHKMPYKEEDRRIRVRERWCDDRNQGQSEESLKETMVLWRWRLWPWANEFRLQKLEQARKWILPCNLQKKCSPVTSWFEYFKSRG